MPFLGLFGKKRAEKAAAAAQANHKARPAIKLVTDHGHCDVSGPPPTAPPTWPLPQRPAVLREEQRPLKAIPESPEPLSVGYTPRMHPSPLASAPVTTYSITASETRRTPSSSSSSSSPRLPSSTPVDYQRQRASPTRVRLPKIPPPGSDDWTPGLRQSRNAFSSSNEFVHDADTSIPLTPPTSVSSFGSAKVSRHAGGSSPNWVSYPVPNGQAVHPAFRRSAQVVDLPPSPVSLEESPEIVSATRKSRRSGRLLAPSEPLTSFKQDWETSLQLHDVSETTNLPVRTTSLKKRARPARSPSQTSNGRRAGKPQRFESSSSPSDATRNTRVAELSKFWHAQTAGTGGSRLSAMNEKKRDEERQRELSRLDEQIRSVTMRLNALETISKRVQTLQAESQVSIPATTTTNRRKDSCIEPQLGHHAHADSTGWETIDDATSELMSLQEKRRTIMLDTSSGSGLSFPSSFNSSTQVSSTRNHSRCDTLDSGFQFPARSATRRRRGAGSMLSRDESAETGLATTVSCIRQAPAVVHMRTITPVKRTRSRRHSRVGGHRAQQASAYSFITFKSVAAASLTPLDRLEESYHEHDCIVEEEEECGSDWEDEDDGGRAETYGETNRSMSSSMAKRLSLFPNPQHTPSASLASTRSASSRGAMSRRSSRSGYRYYQRHQHRYTSSSVDFDSAPQTPGSGVSRRAVAHHSRNPSRLSAVRISPMHVRSNSRVLDESVRAAGNAKMMAHDVKRWFVRVPQRMTFARRGASAARRRSSFFDAGIES